MKKNRSIYFIFGILLNIFIWYLSGCLVRYSIIPSKKLIVTSFGSQMDYIHL